MGVDKIVLIVCIVLVCLIVLSVIKKALKLVAFLAVVLVVMGTVGINFSLLGRQFSAKMDEKEITISIDGTERTYEIDHIKYIEYSKSNDNENTVVRINVDGKLSEVIYINNIAWSTVVKPVINKGNIQLNENKELGEYMKPSKADV